MPCTAYIGLGSNLGDRKGNVEQAVQKIGDLADTRVVKHSSLYESEPHGDVGDWFVNSVIEIETELLPDKLLKKLREIERSLGRKRGRAKKPQPRTIDLDILFYENQIIDESTLAIPHPEVPNRKFVLAPLSELAPQLTHPALGVTVSQLLAATKDNKRLRLYRPE